MKDDNSKTDPEAGKKKPVSESMAEYFSGIDFSKLEISIENMFKSGVHFGHHKSRKNPRMEEYIFTTRNAINIINLEKTAGKLKEAMEFISSVVSEGKEIVFVGTKKQAKEIIKAAALVCEMPYVNERWLGGTFTNFFVISQRTKYLRDGLEKLKKGEYSKYTKFEQMKKAEELERMERKMGGIKNMIKLPGAVFITAAKEDNLALKEAKNKKIPIIAFTDTNVDPTGIDYPIPANEDAVSSLKLILSYIAKAVLEGKKKNKEVKEIKEESVENKK